MLISVIHLILAESWETGNIFSILQTEEPRPRAVACLRQRSPLLPVLKVQPGVVASQVTLFLLGPLQAGDASGLGLCGN